MLSYRHAFHAGNHADVLKHYVLSLVLRYYNQKDKPYWVIDTHAGAGMYALKDSFAQKNMEFETGIARLIASTTLPESVQNYLEAVSAANPNDALQYYPGSPQISAHYLREQDKLRLFELHPNDFKLLQQHFAGKHRQIKAEMADGFHGLKACLPPPTKRAVVLIDPPYELKEDYQRVVTSLQDSLKRFATGTYMVWYPLLQRPEPFAMVQALEKLHPHSWLDVRLHVEQPHADGYGMYGSGMFIINPPWQLPEILNSSMPAITTLLGLDATAQFNLAYAIT